MDKKKDPAGSSDRYGHRWTSGYDDWEISASAASKGLVIFQDTRAGSYSVSHLKFTRLGNDLSIGVPEQPYRLLVKEWFADGPKSVGKVQYRNATTSEEVLHGTYPWTSLADLVPSGLVDSSKREHSRPADNAQLSTESDPVESPAQPAGKSSGSVCDDDAVRSTGTRENDVICVPAGQPKVMARGGDDFIHVRHQVDGPQPDDKEIHGGHGIDTVDYRGAFENADIGITASLAKQTVKWGESGTDRLSSIENLGGTDAADRLQGNKKDNTLSGYRGNDQYTLTRGGGKDVIIDEDDTPGNVDTLAFGKGIRLEELIRWNEDYDVVIGVNGADGEVDASVTIRNGSKDDFKVERFLLSDGSSFTLDQIAVNYSLAVF
jgi:hypothetical protein